MPESKVKKWDRERRDHFALHILHGLLVSGTCTPNHSPTREQVCKGAVETADLMISILDGKKP